VPNVSRHPLCEALAAAAAAVESQASVLNELDAAVGDGDHGTTIARGFKRAMEALAGLTTEIDVRSTTGPAAILTAVGRVLLSTGGASGPLFASMFLEAGKAAGSAIEVSPQLAAALLTAASEGVRQRGGAALGDKTLYDALAPAADAVRRASAAGQDLAAALEAGARAAYAGAEATRGMTGRKGRAGFAGERAIGHPDPGATTVAIVLGAVAQHCRKYGASAGAS
jgi:dihydroxyacetone kinase-like protein